MKNAKPILVTGSHRSGSTWVGKMLATAPRVAYIQEPFSLYHHKRNFNPKKFKYWFYYLPENDPDGFEQIMEGVLRFKYPFFDHLNRVKSLKQFIEVFEMQGMCYAYQAFHFRPLLKDPLALFSAQWLHQKFDMNVIVLVRHPAAFCSSLKIKKWYFDFNHFLEQPQLMETYLSKYETEIINNTKSDKDIIKQAILLWNCIHHTIHQYQQTYPEWIFVRHEDISCHPVEQFRQLYKTLGLEFTPKVQAKILDSSGLHNPAEQHKGSEIKRNSKANINNWKTRLSSEEIALIKSETDQVASLFYSEADW